MGVSSVVIKSFFSGLLFLASAAPAHSQIKSTLKPGKATQLHPGDLIRYYKVRPADKIDGVPYQVLIVVTTGSCTVTTNKWEFINPLSDEQKADLSETIGYQDSRDFRRPQVAPTDPADPSSRLDYYLAFRRKGKTITWNSVKSAQPRLPSLFDFLEVCHYLAKKAKEPE